MAKLKKVIFGLFVAMFAVVALSSCNKDNDEEYVTSATENVEPMLYAQSSTMRAGKSDLPGWNLSIDQGSNYGYKLYERSGDYLQKVNLKSGAYLEVIQTQGQYNSSIPTSPLFPRRSLQYFWNVRSSNALSVCNFQFFIPYDDVDTGTTPCPLAYPVKNGNKVLSTGSANDDGIPKRMLSINTATRQAWISSYSNSSNDGRTVANYLKAPTVFVGTDPFLDNNRSGDWSLGRTMIGIKDQDRDGKKEVIYILTGVYFQGSAAQVLIDLGCSRSDIIMFDGHHSSQMMASGVDYFSGVFSNGVFGVAGARRNLPCALFVKHR
jgi:lipoprotein